MFRGSFRGSPVSEGTEYDVKIEDVASKGDGIARIEGFVIFVPGTKVGDSVRINVEKVMRNFAIANVVE